MNLQIPYRTRRTLGRLGLAALIVLAAAVLVWGCWMLWLQRYVVYTRDQGAKLDLEASPTLASGQVVKEPEQPQVNIYYNEGEDAINTSKELQQLQGYYITVTDLKNTDALMEKISSLPAGTAVVVDVKNGFGNFYYSSAVTTSRSTDVNIEKVDAFFEFLNESGMYTIARFPALRDRNYGLNHVPDGLPEAGGGGWLWPDAEGCYWLDPTSQGTLSHLAQIINELKGMGFDEVLLQDFCFPDTDRVTFTKDRAESLTTAARTLVTACATDQFCVSFLKESDFTSPSGRSRIYLADAEPSQAEQIASASGLADPSAQLVFLTELHDTRFDAYGVIRPLSDAQ